MKKKYAFLPVILCEIQLLICFIYIISFGVFLLLCLSRRSKINGKTVPGSVLANIHVVELEHTLLPTLEQHVEWYKYDPTC